MIFAIFAVGVAIIVVVFVSGEIGGHVWGAGWLFDVVIIAAGSVLDLTRGAAPEKQGARDEVGCIETGDGEGHDVLEYSGGEYVDKGEKAGD